MKSVAVCFSGHPRVFLEHAATWDRFFAMIRSKYNLSTYFHCWADRGLVQLIDGQYVEGRLVSGCYHGTQELIERLAPAAFAIESFSPELVRKCRDFPPVLLSSIQAGRNKILSQLYSVNRADAIREGFETFSSTRSDVVVRMRFDAVPQNLTLNEIDYVADHPEARILFAPSPAWHVHPGGGGGCVECHEFFDAHWLRTGFQARTHQFLAQHHRHANDICDLFAVGSPQTMRRYAQVYCRAEALYRQIQDHTDFRITEDYNLLPDDDNPSDARIQSGSQYDFDIENSPILVPEKLIRFQMSGFLVVHGETVVVIQRR